MTEPKPPSDTLALVLGKLGGVRKRGGYWMANCPAHDDAKASLSVKQGTEQPVILHCHAACETGAILSAIGLTLADISTPRNGQPADEWMPGGRRAIAVYDYTDEAGQLLFQVLRSPDKHFSQRHPDSAARSGWRWNLTGVRRVPYRLPRVLEAVSNGQPVWLAEGERDVHTLEAAGVTASCNPGGAGKWRQEYDQHFARAAVTIVADRDEPGRKHALAVATGLRGVGANVQIVEALAGKDATDHLAAGHGLDMFTPVTSEPAARTPEAEDRPPSQAARLVALARERYDLFTGDDGRPYAVAKNGPAIARPLRGRGGLREQLARIYADASRGAVASASAFTDATAVLEGHASQAGPVSVYLRVAPYRDGIVLDLGTPDGRCIIAGPAGWRTESRSPVLFRRTALTMPLPDPPRPAAGAAALAPLAGLINASPPTFQLLTGWLLAALLPSVPHPILALLGEQGTAKSTTARLLTGLIDPSPAPLRSPPRDIRQWAITASAGWTVCIDNISTIPEWLSDSLCKAVTGDGIVDRALYTDDDVVVLAFRRVIALTSIDAGELRGDLGDRLLPAELDRIADADRRTDEAIAAAYQEARPELLGAILTLLCDCLARLPSVELPAMPRMADFARVLAALDDVTGWRTLAAYEATAADIAETVVESDLFAEAVRELVATEGSEARWEGTASELRERITPAKPPKWWPRNARAASGRLHRCAPSLRRVGVEVTFRRSGGSGARLIIIECADMKCELASHRHDRHAIPGDLPEHADANDIDPGACDANDGVTHDLTLNLLAGEVIDSAEPSSPLETGPCTHCGQPCHRYGDRGNPLCDDCQEGQ